MYERYQLFVSNIHRFGFSVVREILHCTDSTVVRLDDRERVCLFNSVLKAEVNWWDIYIIFILFFLFRMCFLDEQVKFHYSSLFFRLSVNLLREAQITLRPLKRQKIEQKGTHFTKNNNNNRRNRKVNNNTLSPNNQPFYEWMNIFNFINK